MSRFGGRWLLLSLLAATACRVLPEINPGECGNRVIEPGESCDGFGQGEARCRPPGTVGQCQLDCAERSDGTRPECPASHGCDEAGVCRRATGGYLGTTPRIAGNAYSLSTGDFDGDGRADVLGQEAAGPLGDTKFRVHFFENDAALASTWIWPRSVAGLASAPVSDDATSDVVFTDERVGVLLGQRDRTLISETYPTYVVPETVRVAGSLAGSDVETAAPLLLVTGSDEGLAIRRPDASTGTLLKIGELPGRIDELAGDPVVGDLFTLGPDDPCLDTVIAVRGAPEAYVYSVCERDAGSGAVRWRKEALVTPVPLSGEAAIDAGPLVADVDGDGHADVLLGAGGDTWVAFGDGRSVAPAIRWQAELDGAPMAIPMPLAAGDISGDGAAELVFSAGFLLSQRGGSREDFGYRLDGARFGAMWTVARIADLNANGKPDLIAASRSKLDIDFFNGTGSETLNPFVIPTERPVEHLSVGDFDGDLVSDIAWVQLPAAGEAHEVMVAFGDGAGPPNSTVTAARVNDVKQIGALGYAVGTAASALFLVYGQANAEGGEDSAFAWFTGFDRSLMCLVELTTFASDGAIGSVPALAVALGSFAEPERTDAVLLSSVLREPEVNLWWLPDLRGRSGRPQRLGWGFPPELAPVRIVGEDPSVDVLMATGDLDGDGLDELVLAAPDEAGEHCVLATAKPTGEEREPLERSPLVKIDPPCVRAGQLAIEDLDGDSAPDLVLLTGRPGEPRSLIALWNDGGGRFSSDAADSLTPLDDPPQAFALYRPTQRDPLRLAYVTETQLHVLQAARRTRGFEDVSGVPDVELRAATGIAAGDVDGDGIADLMLADSGSVLVLRAELER